MAWGDTEKDVAQIHIQPLNKKVEDQLSHAIYEYVMQEEKELLEYLEMGLKARVSYKLDQAQRFANKNYVYGTPNTHQAQDLEGNLKKNIFKKLKIQEAKHYQKGTLNPYIMAGYLLQEFNAQSVNIKSQIQADNIPNINLDISLESESNEVIILQIQDTILEYPIDTTNEYIQVVADTIWVDKYDLYKDDINFIKVSSNIYPRLYIKDNYKESIQADSVVKKDSKKMASKLGLNLKKLTKGAKKSLDKEWDNAHNIHITCQALVNGRDDDELLCRYLYLYFDNIIQHGEGASIRHVSDNVVEYIYEYKNIKKSIHQNGQTKERWFKEAKINPVLDSTGRLIKYEHIFYHQKANGELHKIVVLNLVMWTKFRGVTATSRFDDKSLSVPVDELLLSNFTKKEKELFLQGALCICVGIVQKVVTKWYQTTAFKVFVAVVAATITVLSAGTATPTGLALVKAVAITTAKNLAIDYAVNIAMEHASHTLSPDALRAVGVVVALVSLRSSFKNFNSLDNLRKANVAFDAYKKFDSFNQLAIQKDEMLMKNEYKTEKERLEVLKHMADTSITPLSLEVQIRRPNPYVVIGETPEMFYARIKSANALISPSDFIQQSMQIKSKR